MPVSNYTATLRVRDSDKGCSVEWSSEFEAKGAPEGDAVAAISGIYEAGFENLKKMFGG
ncbi:SRPBCC family protein [Gillisia sp. Q332]|uniref:SRPBCC family protein n=1 Tax=Gillisia xinjiangensis TaxID=3384765 RepID=UPI00391BF8AF